jgi:hypothetical protein
MKTSTRGMTGNISVTLEPDAYCPRLQLRFPSQLRRSVTVRDENFKPWYEQLLGTEETLFLEDVLFEYIASKMDSDAEKLKTIEQLGKLIAHVKGMVQESIEIAQLENENDA